MKYKNGVLRLADKKYRIKYDVPPANGRPRQQKTETLIGLTKKEAEAALAARKAAIANGQYVKDDDMRLSELFERFMEFKTASGRLEQTTLTRYKSIFDNHLGPAFGRMKAKELKQGHLVSQYARWFQDGISGRKVSGRTIHHAHQTLRNALNWAVRTEIIPRNVATLVSTDDMPKVIKPKPKALKKDELDKLLSQAENPTRRAKLRGYLSADAWFYPAVVFSSHMGTRRGETLAVCWQDLDFDEKTATIGRALTEKLEFKYPKNDKVKVLTMPDSLIAVLEKHRAVQKEERRVLGSAYKDQDLVFADVDGSPVRPWNFGRAVRDLILRAGITPITLHGLRDTHASLLAKAGVPLEVVSKRLGHSNIAITAERYLDVYMDRDKEAAAAFDRVVA